MIYEKRINDRLIVYFEGITEDLSKHLKQNVSAVALEILGIRSRIEYNCKSWTNEKCHENSRK